MTDAPIELRPKLIRFGVFELDQRTGELRKAGVRLGLQDQPLHVLTMLLDRPGELVTREELKQRLWPDHTFVDFEQGLNAAVKRLRSVLGDSADTPQFVETLPRRGYRLIAAVDRLDGAADADRAPAARVRLAAAAGTLLLVALAAAVALRWLRAPPPAPSAGGRIESLAVLPLENLSKDPAQEYFVEGMHEALITDLAKLGGLKRVIARSSVIRYEHRSKPLRDIARDLNVDALVTGAVVQDSGRVRVTVQLIRAAGEELLWTERYEREYRDVIGLQREVVGAIAREIEVEVSSNERMRLSRERPVKMKAYEAYLRGRYHRNKGTHEHYRKAAESLEEAVAEDPDYAPAHAALAHAYLLLSGWGNFAPHDWMPKARQSALRALEIDDRLAEAHVSLGAIKAVYDWDWTGAEREFKAAVELDPGYADGHDRYAVFLARMGRHEHARREIELARQLDPFSANTSEPWVAFMARDYDRAERGYRKILEREPDQVMTLRELAWVYALTDRYAGAIDTVEKANRLSPEDALGIGQLASMYARAGRRKDAMRLVGQLMERRRHEYVSPMSIAQAYVGLGDKDRAFEWLNRAVDDRSGRLLNVPFQPNFDVLRSDPRFGELMRRMNSPS
jgi:TolB-like protein/DNA-binding winged helix-turn-helix (wHTH) protein/Tfp pilus assembly protein PilF